MEHNEIAVFQRSIETCADPAEIARKVKLAFKRMPGEMALVCFAKVMTAEVQHQNARGGFACPCIERELLRLGVDPNYRNNIDLSWNDVKRHVIRSNL